MTYIINANSVIIIKNNLRSEFSKMYFNTEILDDKILEELTFSELLEIWNNLYGIPKNIREILVKKIQLYRKSSKVHSFLYKDKEHWLDKENRASLWNLCTSTSGDVEIVIGDELVVINALKLKAFLLKLEVYSYKCFVNEFKHLKKVKELMKLEDIISYDYTTGYPDKISLS